MGILEGFRSFQGILGIYFLDFGNFSGSYESFYGVLESFGSIYSWEEFKEFQRVLRVFSRSFESF